MPRFRISDLLWLTAVIAVAVVLIGFGQSVFGPSIEGSGCAVLGAIVLLTGMTRIYRQAQPRRQP